MTKDMLETSHEHKKEKNGKTHEISLDKLQKVDCNKQTPKGKKVLEEITQKTVERTPV